jgi:hypothetical protein
MVTARRRLPDWAKVAAGLTLAWSSVWLLQVFVYPCLFWLVSRLDWVRRIGTRESMVWDALRGSQGILTPSFAALVLAGTLLVACGGLARLLARASVRAGNRDFLEVMGAWVAKHPRVLPGLAGLGWLAMPTYAIVSTVLHWGGRAMYGDLHTAPFVTSLHTQFAALMGVFWAVCAAIAFGVSRLTRGAVGILVKPAEAPEATSVAGQDVAERFSFDAVAVTAETRAAVAAVALLPALPLVLVDHFKLVDGAATAVLAAYVATVVGGIAAFRRSSRIAVGLDGLRVSGTSRTRFFAYKDIDRARAKGADVELVRADRVVLRLQLHGTDAAHREALVARLQGAIAQAQARKGEAAGGVVATTSSAALARTAAGALDYRAPALDREQLWEVVTGPEHGADVRAGAAKALVATGGAEDQARLRVAAERCADPKLRVDLLALSSAVRSTESAPEGREEEKEEEEEADDHATRRSTRRWAGRTATL